MKRNRKMWALAALFGAVLAIGGCAGKAVVPTSYSTYNAKDGSFQIQYPAGWEADGGDRSGYAWAKFTSGGAVISVDANVVGSLIGRHVQVENGSTGESKPTKKSVRPWPRSMPMKSKV